MPQEGWHNLGPVDLLKDPPLREIKIGSTSIALSYRDGEFGAVSGIGNHAGGSLGRGRLQGEYIVCPLAQLEIQPKERVGRAGFRKGLHPPVRT